MWKIFFEYSGGGKCTLTGKGKSITKEQISNYWNTYGLHSVTATYQEYPKKR